MTATLHASAYVEGLRPLHGQIDEFVRILHEERGDARRAHERLIIRGRVPMLMCIEHPGGSVGRFRVFPFDLSAGGLGFFHRGYVHPGSRCTFDLCNAARQIVRIQAVVARCVYLSGAAHFVGVQFEVPVEPAKLLGDLGVHDEPIASLLPARTARHPRTVDPWFEQARELCKRVESAVDAQACRELVRDRAEALREFLTHEFPDRAPTHAPAGDPGKVGHPYGYFQARLRPPATKPEPACR